MVKIVGIKFKDAGKLYYFSPGGHKVDIGDNVIVKLPEDWNSERLL